GQPAWGGGCDRVVAFSENRDCENGYPVATAPGIDLMTILTVIVSVPYHLPSLRYASRSLSDNMKLFSTTAALLCGCLLLTSAAAQSRPTKNTQSTESSKDVDGRTSDSVEAKTAAALFEEADNYARRKFEAFEKLKMPYDGQLKQKIEREQSDLAARYAATLAAR